MHYCIHVHLRLFMYRLRLVYYRNVCYHMGFKMKLIISIHFLYICSGVGVYPVI
jgi:hypothetical protein